MNIPVYCISDSYYQSDGLATLISNFEDLEKDPPKPNLTNTLNFLQNLNHVSFRCELYQLDPENINLFNDALFNAVSQNRYLNV
jgi:hypothetical protein